MILGFHRADQSQRFFYVYFFGFSSLTPEKKFKLQRIAFLFLIQVSLYEMFSAINTLVNRWIFSQVLKYTTVTIPAKYPAYLPVRFSHKVRTISLAFCAEIGTSHLKQSLGERPRQTWRATELHASFCVRTHEMTHRRLLPSDWAEKHMFSCTNQKPEQTQPFWTGMVRQ